MMLNKKTKRTILLVIAILIVIKIVNIIPKNYKIKYKISNYTVIESYIKKDKMYTFKIKEKDNIFETVSLKKYTKDRRLINKIKKYTKGESVCIVIDSKKIDNNIICKDNNKYIDYNLLKILPNKYYKKYKTNIKEYKNININLVDNNTYLVWNYTGFYKLNNDKFETIKLFDNDIYNAKILTFIGKYLIIADYNQKYNYNKLIKLNLENNKIEEIKLNDDISFESRIIGTYKNNIYIIDEKNKKEYEINIKKEKMSLISKNKTGRILQNGSWENIKINKIITDNIEFSNDYKNIYEINNGLNVKYKNIDNVTKISNEDIKEIVYSDDEKVYFIVDGKLYKYDFEHGQTEIIDYFELNFNYENMIYVYNLNN